MRMPRARWEWNELLDFMGSASWLFLPLGLCIIVGVLILGGAFAGLQALLTPGLYTNRLMLVCYAMVAVSAATLLLRRHFQRSLDEMGTNVPRLDAKGYACPKCGEPQSLADDAESWYCEYCED